MKKKKSIIILLIILVIAIITAIFLISTRKNNNSSGSSDGIRKNLTAIEVTRLMGNGINLGNTMEAYGRSALGTDADISSYETYWGQPVTTQEIIDSMKAAGFDSLRIPVAWTNGMNFESGDYTIRTELLDRVEEIVNYALNADMYVVINDHWDGGWWGMFGSETEEIRTQAMELYTSMWSQISERFRDYSDYVIFEGANEEVGNRLNDLDLCPDSGSLSVDECYQMSTIINQTFIDTVRSSGGNNTERFLLIPGYNTDVDMTCDERFVMPVDTATDKLIVSVHYYTPWGYCGNSSLSTWGTVKNYTEQNNYMSMLQKFTDAGYGIIIGEYAVCLADDGSVKANTCDFLDNFLDNCDAYGYCPMLWDCSSLFIRTELGFSDENVASLYLNRSYASESNLTQEELYTEKIAEIETTFSSVEDSANEAAAESEGKAISWIMFNSGDWNVMYSVGDTYDPTSITDGLVATDVEVTGAGTYTVGLDFTSTTAGYADSTAFSALAIGNGETLFPGYIITITDIEINGEPYTMSGRPYTTSDNNICTRVNLYNAWVTSVPDDVRVQGGNTNYLSPTILDAATLGHIETIYITFDYGPAE